MSSVGAALHAPESSISLWGQPVFRVLRTTITTNSTVSTVSTVSTAIAALLATALLGGLLGSLGPLAPASAAGSGFPTIRVSDPTVRLGTKVVVSGKGPSLRKLVLQLRTSENGWQPVASTRTGLGGEYSFVAPGWEGSHLLRVVAPATAVAVAEVSDPVTVAVRMPYRPKGPRSDWSWLSHRGARWDPCRPITYRINPAGGYPAARADLRRTFAAVGRVTGFRFTYQGTTGRRVERDDYGYHPAGTDVVVDWQSPAEERGLGRGIAGIGGHWVMDGRRFDGYMILDRSERHPRAVWRQLMSHEIGHILGLGHARTAGQLMHGRSTSANRLWGNGDLSALRRVGPSRGCLPASSGRTAGAARTHVGAA